MVPPPSPDEPWLELTSDAGMARWRAGQGDVLRVTPDGLWPRGEAFIPAERYDRAVVHAWRQATEAAVPAWAGLAAQLGDGTTVCLPAVARPLGRQPEGRSVYWRSSEHPEWTTFEDSGGAIRWSALNDEAVGQRLDAAIHRVLRRGIDTGRAPRKLGDLAGLADGSARVLGVGPMPTAAALIWTPLPAIPRSIPLVPTRPGLTLPAETVRTPTCFRSRGSARLLAQRDFVRLTPHGLELVQRARVDILRYDQIDRIDDAFDVDGIRRLSVVDTAGTPHDLPGLRHGSWAADPSLQDNALEWWHADYPAGAPHGTLPWGAGDDALVITHLRRQLAAARNVQPADLPRAA